MITEPTDAELYVRAREFEDRAHARRQAKLQPARDKRAKHKADYQALIASLKGCRDALLSIPPRMRSGDVERQIKRANETLMEVGK